MSARRHVALVASLLVSGVPVAQAADPRPAETGVLTRPPELIQFVEAMFPPSEQGRTGSVVLSLTIGAGGLVEEAAVSESGGEAFDLAALEAARQFVFTPAEVDGVPTRIRILYRYDFVERVAAPTTAVFTGVVRDREAKVPLAGVAVTLSDGRTVITGADGRFTFDDVAPGTLRVSVEGETITTVYTEETFVAGEQLDATYDIFVKDPDEEGDEMEFVVTAAPLRRQVVSTEVAADEARKVPGTQGDVLRVVESMPGVARASLGTGALVVWGAAPDDTGVYVDGVRVPRLYHDGGLRSVVGSDFVRSVELVPGGYGAAYGRGLGGLVSVKTQDFADEADGVHGSASADLYDAAASLHGRVGERVNLGVGGRYGYVAPLLRSFYPDVEDYFPIPNYYDAQARVGVRLGAGQSLDLTALVSGDRTERTAPNADPAREASDARAQSFQRGWLRYRRDVGDGATTSVVAFAGADQSSLATRYGSVETSTSSNAILFGVRASHRAQVHELVAIEVGLDSEVSQTDVVRRGSAAVPSREGDVRAFGQPPPDQIGADAFRVLQVHVAPYAEVDLGLARDTLHIVGGLRVDPYARSVSRASPQVGESPTYGVFSHDLRAEPRLSIRYAPIAAAYVTAAVGRYGQSPNPSDLSAQFGNPRLPASRGTHVVFGVGGRPYETIALDVSAFYTSSDKLAMRNTSEQPAVAEALLATGSGRSYGAQLMLRVEPTHGFTGWLSYTLSRSERRDTDDAAWRPSDYDQRHVLTALGTYELPLGFEVGLRARVATGYPRTEVTGAVYDVRRDLYQPVFGAHNAIRIPTFFQLDLRVAKHFDIGRTDLDVFLEVQNLTNARNVEEFVYSVDYTTRGTIRGLPILPVPGIRWSF